MDGRLDPRLGIPEIEFGSTTAFTNHPPVRIVHHMYAASVTEGLNVMQHDVATALNSRLICEHFDDFRT